jgi:hypothetical protein
MVECRVAYSITAPLLQVGEEVHYLVCLYIAPIAESATVKNPLNPRERYSDMSIAIASGQRFAKIL